MRVLLPRLAKLQLQLSWIKLYGLHTLLNESSAWACHPWHTCTESSTMWSSRNAGTSQFCGKRHKKQERSGENIIITQSKQEKPEKLVEKQVMKRGVNYSNASKAITPQSLQQQLHQFFFHLLTHPFFLSICHSYIFCSRGHKLDLAQGPNHINTPVRSGNEPPSCFWVISFTCSQHPPNSKDRMQVNNCKELGLAAAVIWFGQQVEAFNSTGASSGQQPCDPAATHVFIVTSVLVLEVP